MFTRPIVQEAGFGTGGRRLQPARLPTVLEGQNVRYAGRQANYAFNAWGWACFRLANLGKTLNVEVSQFFANNRRA
jgi:hypothetical protein